MIPLLYTPSGINFINPKLGWWNDDALIRHHASMVPYGLINDNMNFRKDYKIPEYHFLLGDSGGYQNLTLDKGFSPSKVIRWQEANCDAGMILDFPPYPVLNRGRTADGVTTEKLEYCLERTLYNAQIAMDQRENPKFQLYGVIHGTEWEQLEHWYKCLTKDYQFDGYAMAPKPTRNPIQVARYALFALTHFDEPIHFFLCSSRDVIPVMIWMTKYNRLVTFDNSNYSCAALNYYNHAFWRDIRKFYRISDTKPTTLKKLPCNCPPCTWINEHGGPSIERTNLEFHNYGALHYLYWYLEEIETYQRLLDDEDMFFNMYVSLTGPKRLRLLRFSKRE